MENRELREVFDRLEKSSSNSSKSSTSTKTWSLKKAISKELWPRKLSSVFRWKRVDLRLRIIDDVVFKILSVVEAVVLVSTLCFFFLCCGCHI
ncbi:hypothetical protein RchiOBHm_Chr2g0151771 [Rosa chinensis]|uniref:Transmembrane protein n=1 Tax=Rosa chinensis TaxID=74649 RepID=A0A2P6S081_ROSCH|nr:uncharacterized protein LOC112190089 [Rosa chinensis]PRQ52094.1 hypothetical protein RchiOBHm_Chr2g0151771 [Rosa chinensis]